MSTKALAIMWWKDTKTQSSCIIIIIKTSKTTHTFLRSKKTRKLKVLTIQMVNESQDSTNKQTRNNTFYHTKHWLIKYTMHHLLKRNTALQVLLKAPINKFGLALNWGKCNLRSKITIISLAIGMHEPLKGTRMVRILLHATEQNNKSYTRRWPPNASYVSQECVSHRAQMLGPRVQ